MSRYIRPTGCRSSALKGCSVSTGQGYISVLRDDCTGDAPLTGRARPSVRAAATAFSCAGWEGAAECDCGAGEGRLCGTVSAKTWACFGLCCCE